MLFSFSVFCFPDRRNTPARCPRLPPSGWHLWALAAHACSEARLYPLQSPDTGSREASGLPIRSWYAERRRKRHCYIGKDIIECGKEQVSYWNRRRLKTPNAFGGERNDRSRHPRPHTSKITKKIGNWLENCLNEREKLINTGKENRRQASGLTFGGVSPLHSNETLIALLFISREFFSRPHR